MMSLPLRVISIALSAFLMIQLMGAAPPPIHPISERVTFLSSDGSTMLVGYIFRPEGPHAARMPAVVMMHGRAGAYSSEANGDYRAITLSRRHQQWGHLWAQQGYLAILVDGFGPRGYPQVFRASATSLGPRRLTKSRFARSMLMVRSPGFASATM